MRVKLSDENMDKWIIIAGAMIRGICAHIFLDHIKYIASDLWRKNRKIIRQNNEQDPKPKPVTVFPEVLV